jgi:hypothetical protein
VSSYEQLAALVAAQERIIAQLQARLGEQDARTAGRCGPRPCGPAASGGNADHDHHELADLSEDVLNYIDTGGHRPST